MGDQYLSQTYQKPRSIEQIELKEPVQMSVRPSSHLGGKGARNFLTDYFVASLMDFTCLNIS